MASHLLVFLETVRGGIILKKLVFFGENPKGGGGGLAESKISVNRKKLRIFWIFCQKGGGSHPIQKGFIRKTEIFWHNLPKKGGFIKKTGIFLTISAKRGGVSANPKNPYHKRLVFF